MGEVFRIGDVCIVGNTAILCHLHVVLAEEEVVVVLVSLVGREERPVEQRGCLVVVHAPPVYIVKAEAEVQLSVGVYTKVSREAVFTVLLVTSREVGKVGEGRLGVEEAELVHRHDEVIVRVGEDELGSLLPMKEDARESGRADVSQVVVLTVQSVGELHVLELVHQCVDLYLCRVAEAGVDGPHLESDRYGFRVDRRRIFVLAVSVLVDIARTVRCLFIQLVIVLCSQVISEHACQQG